MIIKKRRIGFGGADGKFQQVTARDDDEDHDAEVVNVGGLRMLAGSFYLPKDDGDGQDAHFISQELNTIGVADGVGGWANEGVDPGIYARDLMSNSLLSLQQQKIKKRQQVNLRSVLEDAFSKTKAKGSSTACILKLHNDELRYINVGDSRFMLFRNNRLVYQSITQQHWFNCPYQLGDASKSDRPSCAYEDWVAVEDGDVVVAGTDGLFDNIWPSEIEKILEEADEDRPTRSPSLIAWSIGEAAAFNSVDESYNSPFAVEAGLAGYEHVGGKHDDITVVVGRIAEQAKQPY